jgi:serine/threonine protein kinase
MAEVWMGRRRAMGGASKAVAIKLLAPHLASKPVYRRMFVDEARLTMMLTHSNIVQVFDVGEQNGRSYLVMEWVDGMDLSRLAASMSERGEVMELHVVAHVIGEILRALAYAHGLTEGDESSTIVHRDISPHNVLISVSGEVKLSDFGVARLASEETSGLHVRGKLRYMPPEQVRGESKHATIDLFAVGALMQELLDGVRFRAGLERDELFGMVLAGEVPPLRRAGVPAELRAVRDALLAKERGDRVQSAEQALSLLRRWSGYRNGADELAELVRGRAGVAAPRTGLTVDFSDDVLEPSDEPTMREGSEPPCTSELATRTVRSADEAASETTPHPVAGELSSRQRRRLPAVLGLAVAGLGVSLGFGYAWLHQPASSAASPLVEPDRVERAEAPVPELSPAAPKLEAPPKLAPAQEPELEPAPEPEPERKPASRRADGSREAPQPVGTRPAEVEFAAHEFFFVWVKVGERVHALEPVAKVSLRPGRHKVYLRQSADEPWVAAGRIEVESGAAYRVKLRKPASLALARK